MDKRIFNYPPKLLISIFATLSLFEIVIIPSSYNYIKNSDNSIIKLIINKYSHYICKLTPPKSNNKNTFLSKICRS